MRDTIEALYSDITENQRPIDDLNHLECECIEQAIANLNCGKMRICFKDADGWHTNEWLKKSILIYFRIKKMSVISSGIFNYFDKIPVKNWDQSHGVRVVPQAIVRYGAYVAPGAVLMPSYVNIGAYVGENSMVDTWATVGSCAQIGKNVHLSGGVGIGGVLEPVQAHPVVIEDNAFIGSRCIVVEGVRIGAGAVLGAGVTLTASTQIIDVRNETPVYLRGNIPENAVVIPGVHNKKFAGGTFGVTCALIIGVRKESTNLKTSLNNALRDYEVAV